MAQTERIRFTIIRLIVPLLFVASTLAANAEQWQNRTIYQLLTDRFATPDESSPPCNTSAALYCGGTWRGIVRKLDYIQNLGFDAIWISPVVANVEEKTIYGEAFHGYWARDLNSLNSHFGTADDLKALSTALHKRNMYLMVDVVANHMGATSSPPDFSMLKPFSTASNFHPECYISNYENQTDIEQCWLGDKNVPLADLNTEDDGVVKTLYAWIKGLVNDYDIDGVRIDTVLNVRKDFWPGFAQAAGVFTMGEVFHTQTARVAPYTHALDSVLDYPTYFPLVSAFNATTSNITTLAEKVWQAQAQYKSGELMVGSFLENHDQPRFQSRVQDQALVRNAMAWPFVQDGMPILYQGQEQGYQGGQDPANREALWLSGYVQDKPLATHVKILNAARKAAIAYNASFLKTPAKLYAVSEHTIAVSKPPMLALLTNVGNASVPNWNVPDAGYKANEELVDVLTCNKVVADEHGGVVVAGSAGNPQILLPATALSPTGKMCANMAKTSTAQASSAVAGPRHTMTAMTGVSELFAQALPLGIACALAFIASHSSLIVG